jgi:hypothetical protein
MIVAKVVMMPAAVMTPALGMRRRCSGHAQRGQGCQGEGPDAVTAEKNLRHFRFLYASRHGR